MVVKGVMCAHGSDWDKQVDTKIRPGSRHWNVQAWGAGNCAQDNFRQWHNDRRRKVTRAGFVRTEADDGGVIPNDAGVEHATVNAGRRHAIADIDCG